MHTRTPHRSGITLIETCLSTIIVGGLLGASITAVGNLATARQITSDRAKGYQLAEDLLTESQMLPYVDPALSADQIGPSATELVPGNRSLFNDCDDYDSWSESPPQEKSGTVISGFNGWKRTVRVQWVNPSASFSPSVTSTGYKQITVAAIKNGKTVATLSCIKGAAWNDAVWLNGASTSSAVTTSRSTQVGAAPDRVSDASTGSSLLSTVTGIVNGAVNGLLGR
jgi:Tfp pilus assembly protein PilV